MNETQGVIKKNGAINPNRENISFVKNLSYSISEYGTSVFMRELLLLICASPQCIAHGSYHLSKMGTALGKGLLTPNEDN